MPMRVAIDIRRAGDYGFGTYIRNIVNQLGAHRCDSTQYLLIGKQRHLEQFDPLPGQFRAARISARARHPCTRTCICRGCCANAAWTSCTCPGFMRRPWCPTRLVITVHDLSDVLDPPPACPPLLQAGRLFFARRALRRADRIFAVSHSSKRELARVFAFRNRRSASCTTPWTNVSCASRCPPTPTASWSAMPSPTLRAVCRKHQAAEKSAATDRSVCRGQRPTCASIRNLRN